MSGDAGSMAALGGGMKSMNPQMMSGIMQLMNTKQGQSMMPGLMQSMQGMRQPVGVDPRALPGMRQPPMPQPGAGMGGQGGGMAPGYQSPWWAQARVNPNMNFQPQQLQPLPQQSPYQPQGQPQGQPQVDQYGRPIYPWNDDQRP